MKTIINEKKRVFINTLLVNSTIIIEKSLFFFINIIVARYFSVQDFGEYVTALGYATFFSSFVDVGINQTMIRAINLKVGDEKKNISSALLINSVLSTAIYLIMSFSLFFTGFNTNVIKLTLILGIVRFISEILKTFYSSYDAREKFKVYTLSTITYSALLFLTTLLVVQINGDYFDLSIFRLIVTCLILVFLVCISFKTIDFKIGIHGIINFIKQSIPFALYTIFLNLIQRINIIFVSFLCGTTAAGFFNNSFLFFTTLFFIPNSFTRVLVPFLYKIDIIKSKLKYQFTFDTFSKVYSILSFYLFIIIFIFSDKIILLIYGEKYIPAIMPLRILALGIPSMFNIATNIIMSIDKQEINTKIMFISVIVNIISNSILIYMFNIAGAAIAVVLTFMTIFFLSYYYLWIKKYINMKNVLKINIKLMFTSAICILLATVMFPKFYFIVSFIIISLIYTFLVLILLIRGDDIRIIKETLGLKELY